MICTDPNDPFLEELQIDHGRGIWIAELSDGQMVYSDDFRPKTFPWNAWERLRAHCLNNQLDVVGMEIGFRKRRVRIELPENAQGVFLVHGMLKAFDGSSQIDVLNIGHVHGDTIYYQKWQLPELHFILADARSLKDYPPQQVIPRCQLQTGTSDRSTLTS